jgi:hypothetical protein
MRIFEGSRSDWSWHPMEGTVTGLSINVVSVIFTHYAAVFSLSELINFFQRHARGQCSEEIPHAY